MAMNPSDWDELARLTARLDELRDELNVAEAESGIARIYALEEQILEMEERRAQVFRSLQDRLIEQAAA